MTVQRTCCLLVAFVFLGGCRVGQTVSRSNQTVSSSDTSTPIDVRHKYDAYPGEYLVVEDISVGDYHPESILFSMGSQKHPFFSGSTLVLAPAEYGSLARCITSYKPSEFTPVISLEKPCFMVYIRQADQLTTLLVTSSKEAHAFFEHLSACSLPISAQQALHYYQAAKAKP